MSTTTTDDPEQARAHLEELREKARDGGKVTATDLAKARDNIELAVLRAEAADRAAAKAQAQQDEADREQVTADAAALIADKLPEARDAYVAAVRAIEHLRATLADYTRARDAIGARATRSGTSIDKATVPQLDADTYASLAEKEARLGFLPVPQMAPPRTKRGEAWYPQCVLHDEELAERTRVHYQRGRFEEDASAARNRALHAATKERRRVAADRAESAYDRAHAEVISAKGRRAKGDAQLAGQVAAARAHDEYLAATEGEPERAAREAYESVMASAPAAAIGARYVEV